MGNNMYEYREGKKRILEIIDNKLEIEKGKEIPNDKNFTFENAYYGRVSAIFVDIRNSTELFANENKVSISKIIRCFSSEVIEILNDPEQLREIGIRGDCVYAVYNTPNQSTIQNVFDKAVSVNTFLKMLNTILKNCGLLTFKAGIGMSTDEELVVKAGRKGSGINNLVWIGKAVTFASELSSMANKDGIGPLAISSVTYNNLQENQDIKKLFVKGTDSNGEVFYHAKLIYIEFNKWIEEGMK